MDKRTVTRSSMSVVGIICGVMLVAAVCYAIPQTINYQGYLTDSEGHPLDGAVDIVFALYEADTGGSPLWTETQTGVPVTDGLFSVNLGEVNPITLPFDNPYWLGVTVDTDSELTPRQPVTSVGYALRSGMADTVEDGSVTGEMIADGAVSLSKLADVCPVGDYLIKTPTGWGCFSASCVPQTEVCDGVDNDCNEQIDDGPLWSNKNQPCTVGAGICAASGIYICNEADPGGPTVCSVTAGAPGVEICDGLDNDCDTIIDNNLTDSQPCANQKGVCAGSMKVCGGASGWLTCGPAEYGPDYEPVEISCDGLDNDCDGGTDKYLLAVPCANQQGVCAGSVKVCGGASGWLACGPAEYGFQYEADETTCDGLDNDCDGFTDEGWLNAGKYDQDTACGNCSTDCTVIYNKPHASGSCDSTGAPVCKMDCDAGYLDLNDIPDDGCEFQEDSDAIYVSTPANGGNNVPTCGDFDYPCATISYGSNRASASGKAKVFVSSGVYYEDIDLDNGISLLGGYNPVTWVRDVDVNPTVLYGSTGSGNRRTVRAENINAPTTFDGFVIYAANAASSSAGSYGIWIRNSNNQLSITNNVIWPGSGGNGTDGNNGSNGMTGVNGQAGIDAYDTGISCYTGCESLGGTGGSQTCEALNVSGGNGGTAFCPDFNETMLCTECASTDDQTITSGADGPNGGGSGGLGGGDGQVNYTCFGDCALHVPMNVPQQMSASNGGNAPKGTDGTGGYGCSNPDGYVSGEFWIGIYGVDGTDGSHGRGGGGGGTGGGVETADSPSCANDGGSDVGGSGGGGGSGGCGGTGGSGGSAGGGSFAIFVVFSSPPGANIPVIANNAIHRGEGGDGGRGGNGGYGGEAGLGASGGAGGVIGSDYWGASPGGAGGNGGRGGHGGGGGGGCGGVSYGIYAFGQGGADLSSWSSTNTFFSDGIPGTGGTGGASAMNPGDQGMNGASGNTNF